MSELKTLKDLEKEHEEYTYEDSVVTANELKEEAINLVKSIGDNNGCEGCPICETCPAGDPQGCGVPHLLKHFFNITEEKLKFKRCPNNCEENRELFDENSKQRKGIFHDEVGKCSICGQEITEEELK